MKIISDYTDIDTLKNLNLKLCLISDIHHSFKSEKSFYDEILLSIKNSGPDIIIIAGDILDEGIVISEDKSREIIEDFIFSLTKISKVIIALGNHDQKLYKNKKANFEKTWYKSLERFNNLTFLDNEKCIYKDIEFTSFIGNYNLRSKEYKHDITNKIKKHIHSENDIFKILICHSPVEVLKKKNKEFFSKFNLILCGHMHNGALPIFLEKSIFRFNKMGILSPFSYGSRFPFPLYVRGLKSLDSSKIIVSKGIKKIPKRVLFSDFFSKFYSVDVNYLNLK